MLQCCRPLWSDLQCLSGICWWWSSCWLPEYDHPPSAFHSGPQDCPQWSDLFYEAWPHMCFRLKDYRRVCHTARKDPKETELGDKEKYSNNPAKYYIKNTIHELETKIRYNNSVNYWDTRPLTCSKCIKIFNNRTTCTHSAAYIFPEKSERWGGKP